MKQKKAKQEAPRHCAPSIKLAHPHKEKHHGTKQDRRKHDRAARQFDAIKEAGEKSCPGASVQWPSAAHRFPLAVLTRDRHGMTGDSMTATAAAAPEAHHVSIVAYNRNTIRPAPGFQLKPSHGNANSRLALFLTQLFINFLHNPHFAPL